MPIVNLRPSNLALTLAVIGACLTGKSMGQAPILGPLAPPVMPPAAPREFRSAWVATVANIDWPSRPGLSTSRQQREAIAVLDQLHALNMNAVILQIRTTADALYDSKFEPWSHYLTGLQGRPPSPYYDPLEFWIEQAKLRGIEVHAWFNPYRARHASARGPLSPDHAANANPEWVVQYGNMLWLDPGHPQAAQRSLDVFMDVVDRYDLDGIHIDDYFYPYPVSENGAEVPFPDDATYKAYLEQMAFAGEEPLKRDDWRRDNVNKLVKAIYEGIRARKPHVKFGISPFGIGKPSQRPEGIRGFSQYDKLFADAELWLEQGWCDYWTPQLYWPINRDGQQFPVLLDYWTRVNPKGRAIWPGLGTYRAFDNNPDRDFDEVVRQIEITREQLDSPGHAHFSMKVFMDPDNGLSPALRDRTYQKPALIPPMPWLDDTAPPAPALSLGARWGQAMLQLKPAEGEQPRLWAVWTLRQAGWVFDVLPASETSIPLGSDVQRVVVTAVDRGSNESPRVVLDLPAPATGR
jgi:uncharacterized lipoprotein YddW (UPF0748 family)